MEWSTAPAALRRYIRVVIALYVVALILAVTPYTSDPTGDIKWLITAWIAGGLTLLWIFASWRWGLRLRRPRLLPGVLALFFLLFVLAALPSEFRGFSILEVKLFFFLMLLYFLASQSYSSDAQVRGLMAACCMGMTVAACYGFAQRFGWDPFPWADRDSEVYRALPSTFGNPNFAGHMLVLATVMSVYLASVRGWRWAILFLPFLVTHLLLTGQRAALVALAAAAGLVLIAVLVRRRTPSPARALIWSLGIAVVIGISLSVGVMAFNQWRTGNLLPLDTSILIRYVSYVSASQMVLDAPLLGHGPAVYAIKYPLYWTPFEQEWFAQQLKMNQHVHNDLLELAIDAGIPAAGLYLALLLLGICYALLLAFRPGSPARRHMGYALAAIFMAFLVDGFFGFNLRVPVSAAIIFLFLGVLEGLWIAPAEALSGARLRATEKVWRIPLGALAVFFILLQSAVFVSEVKLLQGIRSQYLGKWESARARLNQGWSIAPWNWHFPRRLGQVYLAEGDFAAAENLLVEAARLNPYYVMTHVPLAHSRMAEAQQTLALQPEEPRVPLEMLLRAGEAARDALKLAPMLPVAEDILGRIASMTAVALSSPAANAPQDQVAQQWRTADEFLMRALQHGALNQGELYLMVAKVRVARGENIGAEEALVSAVQADPDNQAAWQFFYEFATSNDRYDLINHELQGQISRLRAQATPDAQTIATSYLWLAKVLEHGFGDFRGADDAFLSAVEFGALRPEVWANLAVYANQRGREGILRQALLHTDAQQRAASGEALSYISGLAEVLTKGAPALDEASTQLLNAFKLYQESADMPLSIALGWAAKILLEEAEKAAAAPEAEPSCRTYLNLGIMYAMLEELPLAEGLFQQTSKCADPEIEQHLIVNWADTMMRLDRQREALDLLMQAHAKYPENPDIHWALARTYVKLGDIPQAVREYEALMESPAVTNNGKARLLEEMRTLL